MATTQRQDLTLGLVVSAIANGVAYGIAAAVFLLASSSGPNLSSLEGLIFSWMAGFCGASALVGLPFLFWRRNRSAAVGWVFGLAIVQACAICAGVGLGLTGFLDLPT